jgi:hypothetical protein
MFYYWFSYILLIYKKFMKHFDNKDWIIWFFILYIFK